MWAKYLRVLPICGHRCQRNCLVLLVILLISFCGSEFLTHRASLAYWDMLLVSGVFAFIAGLWLAQSIPRRFDKCIGRLVDRGALKATQKTLLAFMQSLESALDTWARTVGLLLASAMLLAFLIALWDRFSIGRIFLTVGEVLGGYVAGTLLGRMACYGRLGRLLVRNSIKIDIVPGHLDGVAGLKPVGDFYFFQAAVVSIPAVYLALWLLVIPIWPRDYGYWREPFLGLLIVAVTIEILAFLVPLWSFHTIMQEQKKLYLATADKLSKKISGTQAKLAKADSGGVQSALKEQLSEMTKHYWAIETMPTWPVDLRTRRRFSSSNFVLLLPVISNWIGGTATWQQFIDIALKIFGNGA